MPVAMITTSATRSPPAVKLSRGRPFTSAIFVSLTPVRTFTPWRFSHASTSPAPVSSIIRGRMRGATSTIVSEAPRARMELRMVNAMKPAPTMTT